ncbi:hypothetical protein DERP_001520 [Dermatophagoides pteronyssinus]|uniref:Uncharacterized protein n=1 Tax=Dermatophagoides pteronyssinus TaxID=6956 RepID=A0ABQ8JET3_DERPT|nr:hypothetical protein DERP_001520 [Dermatophagoides pteronyssinus]
MDIQGANTFLSGCNDDYVFVDDHDDSIQARSITEHHLMISILRFLFYSGLICFILRFKAIDHRYRQLTI